MRVHATQAAKSIARHTHPLEVRQFDPARIAYRYIFNVTLAVDEHAYLAIRLVRQLAQLPCKFRRHDLIGADTALVKLLNTPQLVRFQAVGVSMQVLHLRTVSF